MDQILFQAHMWTKQIIFLKFSMKFYLVVWRGEKIKQVKKGDQIRSGTNQCYKENKLARC